MSYKGATKALQRRYKGSLQGFHTRYKAFTPSQRLFTPAFEEEFTAPIHTSVHSDSSHQCSQSSLHTSVHSLLFTPAFEGVFTAPIHTNVHSTSSHQCSQRLFTPAFAVFSSHQRLKECSQRLFTPAFERGFTAPLHTSVHSASCRGGCVWAEVSRGGSE